MPEAFFQNLQKLAIQRYIGDFMQNQNELTPAEKWERLTFADNYIFCK